MTTHYLIHSPSSGRTLKVSYKAGKFFRLEKVSGSAITETEMEKLGSCIPPTEKEVSHYILAFPKLQYSKVEKEQSIYQKYVSAWFSFYTHFMEGIAPKFTKADGQAINQIKAYLTQTSGSEADGLALFQMILDNWGKLDKFHQENTDLKYLNSRLNVILNGIKKAGKANTGGSDNSVRF